MPTVGGLILNQAEELDFASIGSDVQIWPLAKIISPNRISIGNSVMIDDFVFIGNHYKVDIGSFIHIPSFTSLTGGGKIIMEDFSGTSSGVRIFSGNEDYLGGSLAGAGPTLFPPYRTPIRSYVHICRHAIIGANSVVLPGVKIGEGAVIGANSLVKSDCEPWTIYVGSPVRAIKTRPRERMIELEAQLRSEFFDEQGNYIPKANRD